jgi:hypothetical protein
MPKKQPDFSAPAANLDSGIALQTEGFYRAQYCNPRERGAMSALRRSQVASLHAAPQRDRRTISPPIPYRRAISG